MTNCHLRKLIVANLTHICDYRDSLCFCTEPIFASLANVLGQRSNINNPSQELMSYNLNEIEIKYGLMQVRYRLVKLT